MTQFLVGSNEMSISLWKASNFVLGDGFNLFFTRHLPILSILMF